jgi:mono/diheme cytochrome c family protein
MTLTQKRRLALALLPLLALGGAWALWPGAAAQSQTLIVPDLQGEAVIGARVYAVKCAACHGENGVGVEGAGPPFLHKIYEPSHHGDGAFFNAALNGVRAHHWRFGNMPPVDGITEAEIAAVVQYVRALQQANGI